MMPREVGSRAPYHGAMSASVTIYHNPRCSNSRGTLALLREAGIEPEVIEYLKTPPDASTLRQLLQEMGLTARELIRDKEPVFAELGLADQHQGEDALLQAMVSHPELINRPIVRTAKGTQLCRPPEKVKDLLALGL